MAKPVCKGHFADGRACTYTAKENGYCGKHVKQADAKPQQALPRPTTVVATTSAPASKPAKSSTAPAAPSQHPMVTRSKVAAERVAKSKVKLLPAGDSVTNAMGSGTAKSVAKSELPSAKQHWLDCVGAGTWPAQCCECKCQRPPDRGGHVFITGKFTKVYIVPVCPAHNLVKQHFQVKAGTRAVQDPTIGVLGVGRMGLKHLFAANFALLHRREP